MKKLLLLILSCLLFTVFGLVGCGCNGSGTSASDSTPKEITIENFNDLTVTAGYNTEFSLAQYLTAVDSEGTGHKCSVIVKDANGEIVATAFDTFEVSTTDDYTAVCKVNFNGKAYERTITIKVVDDSLPKITVGELKTGSTGTAYSLPEITVTKALGELVTPVVNVYYIDRISMEEQTVENGAFTPTKAGNYRMVVTAEDSLGNVGTATLNFFVRTGMSGEVLEDFTDQLSATSVKSTTDTGVWYKALTLGGETRNGVVKAVAGNVNTEEIPDNGNHNFFRVTFNRTIKDLEQIGEDFDYITMKLYVETEQAFADNQTSLWSWSVATAPFEVNQWQTVTFSKDMILGTKATSYWSNDYAKETNAGLYQSVADYFWNVHAEDGTNATSMFQLKGLTSPASVYIDEVALVRTEISAFDAPTSGDVFTVPTATLRGVDGSTVATSTQETTEILYRVNANAAPVPVTAQDGKITASAGNYDINYAVSVGNNIYTKSISFTAKRKAMAANMLEDFSDRASLDNVLNANNVTDASLEAWHAEYDGHAGVVQVSGKGSQVDLKFNRTQAELNAIDFDYITVNMYVDVGWILTNTQIFGVLKKMQNRQWITLTITKEELITAHGSVEAFFQEFSSEGRGRRFAYISCHEATFYIDDISFGKN